jgi:tight adherence protein C
MIRMRSARLRRRLAHDVVAARPPLRRLGALLSRAQALHGRDESELGAQAVGAALGAFAFATSAHGARALAAAALGAVTGWHGGKAFHARTELRELAAARATLPATLDRLATCVLAGMSVERALRVVTPGTSGRLGDAFTAGLRALDAGVPRARAYDIIAARAGLDEVRALADALARAERFGSSISQALLARAADVRATARAQAEAEARAAPVKMVFPLVFCFLPAFVLLVIGPIAIGAVRSLGGI